jgi:hypothetical protein
MPTMYVPIHLVVSPTVCAQHLQDLLAALGHTKQGNHVAQLHRKKTASFTTRLAGYVVSSLNTTGVGWIKSMTDVERHAELVYAESLFEKVRVPCFVSLIT